MAIDIYTDGSCLKNPGGPGGYAAIILVDGKETHRLSGYDPATTNNRMEMMGVIAALEALPISSAVTIYSDSTLVINCGSRKWKRRKNRDLWLRFDAAASRHQVRWKWVPGHSGDRWNEQADALCGYAARNGESPSARWQAEDAPSDNETEFARIPWERFANF
jgi:ribonuclease HI